MSNNYLKFIRHKNVFGDDLFIEGDDEFGSGFIPDDKLGEDGWFSKALQIINPVSAAKSYYKKGVSGVITEARTELAQTDSVFATTLGLNSETADYVRAKDPSWKGTYSPDGGVLYYWDKNTKIIRYINPETGKYVRLKSNSKGYKSISNSNALAWSPTSKSYFPNKVVAENLVAAIKDREEDQADKQVKKIKKSPSSTALTTYNPTDDMSLEPTDDGILNATKQHVKDNWIAYSAAGAGVIIGIPLLMMAFGSTNKNWSVIMDGVSVGTISEFYEVNKIGNKHQIVPISDMDMTMILALQPGEKHPINSANGTVIVERGIIK